MINLQIRMQILCIYTCIVVVINLRVAWKMVSYKEPYRVSSTPKTMLSAYLLKFEWTICSCVLLLNYCKYRTLVVGIGKRFRTCDWKIENLDVYHGTPFTHIHRFLSKSTSFFWATNTRFEHFRGIQVLLSFETKVRSKALKLRNYNSMTTRLSKFLLSRSQQSGHSSLGFGWVFIDYRFKYHVFFKVRRLFRLLPS